MNMLELIFTLVAAIAIIASYKLGKRKGFNEAWEYFFNGKEK